MLIGTARLGGALAALLLLAACAPESPSELKPGAKAIILTGTVYPVEEAQVRAPVAAMVTDVLVQVGVRVPRGQVVVRLDPAQYAAEVRQIQAEVEAARAGLAAARIRFSDAEVAQARAEVERSRLEVERQRRLLEAPAPAPSADGHHARIVLQNARQRLERMYSLFSRRLISRTELESVENEYAEALRRFEASRETVEVSPTRDLDVAIAETRHQTALAKLAEVEAGTKSDRAAVAQAQLAQAEARLERARYNLSQTALAAPISGIVTEVSVQPGERIIERAVLLKIVEINRVEVRADLSPGLLPHVRVGQSAKLTVNTVPPITVDTTVHRIHPIADPKTQSLSISFLIPNQHFKFQPGFTARVEIPVEPGRSPDPAPRS